MYYSIFTSPKKKKEVKQKIQTSILGVLQQEEDVKSRNHSVPFESDSIKQQRGVPNHRQQTIKFTWGNGQMANFVQVQPSECLEYDRPTLREALLLAKGLFVLMSMKQDTSIFNLLKCLLTSANDNLHNHA